MCVFPRESSWELCERWNSFAWKGWCCCCCCGASLKGILCCMRQVVSQSTSYISFQSQRSISWGLILFSVDYKARHFSSSTFNFHPFSLSILDVISSLVAKSKLCALSLPLFLKHSHTHTHTDLRRGRSKKYDQMKTLLSQFCGENEFLCFMISTMLCFERISEQAVYKIKYFNTLKPSFDFCCQCDMWRLLENMHGKENSLGISITSRWDIFSSIIKS